GSRPHQLPELGLVGDVDRVGGHMRLGVPGAVPVEIMSTRPPATSVVLGDRDLGVGGAVGSLDVAERTPDRKLPADVRLGLERMAVLAQSPTLPRASPAA